MTTVRPQQVAPVEVRPGVFDLSTVHRAISDTLYPYTQTPEDYRKCKLPDDLIREFWEQGVITNVPLLTSQDCDLILEECQHLMDVNNQHPAHALMYEYHSNQSADPDNVLVHSLGHWRMTTLLHDLVFHPKVTAAASQLLVPGEERAVRFWHDQFFAKPARHGGVVAWHQDYSYWTRTTPMMHLTVHVALEDQTEENGGLLYIKGSHRWTRNGGNPLPVLDFNFKDMEGIKTILTPEEVAEFKPVPALLKKGEASFHHPLMVHGSYSNRSDSPRRAAVLNYFADGVMSNTDNVMLKELEKRVDPSLFAGIDISKGKPMQGQFYPLVYDPKWAL